MGHLEFWRYLQAFFLEGEEFDDRAFATDEEWDSVEGQWKGNLHPTIKSISCWSVRFPTAACVTAVGRWAVTT